MYFKENIICCFILDYQMIRVNTTSVTITSRSVLQLGLSHLENNFAETTFQPFSFVDIFHRFGGSSVGVYLSLELNSPGSSVDILPFNLLVLYTVCVCVCVCKCKFL